MANRQNQAEIDRLRGKINGIRRKMVLCESEEEASLYLEEINELKDQIHKINRKKPVVVPVKDAHTVGEKIEDRLKTGRRRRTSSYRGNRVKL